MPHITLPDGLPGITGPFAFRPETAKLMRAVAAHYLGVTEEQEKLVQQIKCHPSTAPISPKLKALLNIAGHVRQSGKQVTAEDIAQARRQGATDFEIHDTVLIAANFCMMNRYVDGLATRTPEDPDFYRERAAGIAVHGYAGSTARS